MILFVVSLIWCIVAFIGIIVTFFILYDVHRDFQAVNFKKITNGRLIIAKSNLRRVWMSLFVHISVFLVALGLTIRDYGSQPEIDPFRAGYRIIATIAIILLTVDSILIMYERGRIMGEHSFQQSDQT